MLQSLKSIWTKQWTALWGWLKVTSGATVAVLPTVGHVLNDSKVGQYIDQLHLDPKIGLLIAAIGVVTLASEAH